MFFNGCYELVGFDVALIHRLAIELDARLEFVPVRARRSIAPTACVRPARRIGRYRHRRLAVTPARAEAMQLESHLDETLGSWSPTASGGGSSRGTPSARGALTIAVPDVALHRSAARAAPEAQLWPVATFDAMFHAPAGAAAFALPASADPPGRCDPHTVVVPAQAAHRAAGVRHAAWRAGPRHVRRHVDRSEAARRHHRRACHF
jgi:hypothetical protein